MLTLLDTEINEAESIVRYLEKQNYQFIDIWFHDFSREVAYHIYENYLLKVNTFERVLNRAGIDNDLSSESCGS